MRQISESILQERKARVLYAVIHEYIKTGKPVGSSVLEQKYKFNLSPATLRNLMAELEKDGYLTHPHTSAGRIPTDAGYKAYVNSLVELQRLAVEEERQKKEKAFYLKHLKYCRDFQIIQVLLQHLKLKLTR